MAKSTGNNHAACYQDYIHRAKREYPMQSDCATGLNAIVYVPIECDQHQETQYVCSIREVGEYRSVNQLDQAGNANEPTYPYGNLGRIANLFRISNIQVELTTIEGVRRS